MRVPMVEGTATDRTYFINAKRNGKFYVSAVWGAGAEVGLPFNEHYTVDAAKEWIAGLEEKAAERARERARHPEERIRL